MKLLIGGIYVPKEKIGSDVLGKRRRAKPYPLIPEELRKRLEELEEERKRRLAELGIEEGEKAKIRQLEEEGNLPKLPIPSDYHEKKLGEAGYDKIIKEQERKRKAKEKAKTVHVDEHYRRPPGEAGGDEE